MESYLEALAGRLRETGVDRVDFKITVDNNPARSLLEFSEAEAVDLIALSTWGRGGVTRLVLGSVADKLIRGAKMPVLTGRR